MSKADEMFKKLGYIKQEHNFNTTGRMVEYEHDKRAPITFMIENKIIKIWAISLGMQELQAINEKVKELQWI